ncbi:MAG: hypothetical protein ACAI44_16815 [Candidatus Sericytochromatia bacterium]
MTKQALITLAFCLSLVALTACGMKGPNDPMYSVPFGVIMAHGR